MESWTLITSSSRPLQLFKTPFLGWQWNNSTWRHFWEAKSTCLWCDNFKRTYLRYTLLIIFFDVKHVESHAFFSTSVFNVLFVTSSHPIAVLRFLFSPPAPFKPWGQMLFREPRLHSFEFDLVFVWFINTFFCLFRLTAFWTPVGIMT